MRAAELSLRARLTIAVAVVLGVSLTAFSLVLSSAFHRALWQQFDERIGEDAATIANMVEERAAGPWMFEAGSLEEFERKRGAAFFEVRMDDGTVLARSPTVEKVDLPKLPAAGSVPVVMDVELPGCNHGRLFTATFMPRQDEASPLHPSGRRVTVSIVRDLRSLEDITAMLSLLLAAFGLTTLALTTVAAMLVVRHSLRPVEELADTIAAIDEERLGDRIPVEGLPIDLRPQVDKLNELLSRLEASFARERQFSAAVSHELRTPLAALLCILEVAASRERSAAMYQDSLRESLTVVRQMQGLVENLLILARTEAKQWVPVCERIDLSELVNDCSVPYLAKASARGLSFTNRIPSGQSFFGDRKMLSIVLSNLLANAVEYTDEGGWIAVESDPAKGIVLAVRDSGPQLPDDSLESIFDRFFRLEPSRSGTEEHHGIGLALVRALSGVLALHVEARNYSDGSVAFSVWTRPHLTQEA